MKRLVRGCLVYLDLLLDTMRRYSVLDFIMKEDYYKIYNKKLILVEVSKLPP